MRLVRGLTRIMGVQDHQATLSNLGLRDGVQRLNQLSQATQLTFKVQIKLAGSSFLGTLTGESTPWGRTKSTSSEVIPPGRTECGKLEHYQSITSRENYHLLFPYASSSSKILDIQFLGTHLCRSTSIGAGEGFRICISIRTISSIHTNLGRSCTIPVSTQHQISVPSVASWVKEGLSMSNYYHTITVTCF
ncbi:hypothetical protein VNO77_03551 [Canavalia gladiata]|uniref:Uncharacterized protein n=1 Tax=Canavalia gladiata TaxID=3824 RepID=A0AAN9MZY6_CANGL